MLKIRRWGAAVVVATTITAGACVQGSAPPSAPSDDIEVTPITFPEGDNVRAHQLMMNERGDVVVRPTDTDDYFLWQAGEVTPINPEGLILRPEAISDKGQVVGAGAANWAPFSWADGELEGLPTGEADGGRALDVNNQGTIAGILYPELEGVVLTYPELVVWDGGELIRPPERVELRSTATVVINDRNQVAFTALIDGHQRAAIWDVDAGEVLELGTLGGDTSSVAAINGRGMVLGNSRNAARDDRAFLWHDGEMTDLGTLGGNASRGIDLNEWGQVVGVSWDADGVGHAFLWHEGEMTQIDWVEGHPNTGTGHYPAAINNWGQVVSVFVYTPQGGWDAFLWQNGRAVNLGELANPDAGVNSRGIGINDRGQVLGYTSTSTAFASNGFLWTVPPLWGYPDGP